MNDFIAKIKINSLNIDAEKNQIYKYINKNRYQHKLIQNLETWNQICSSLYVIGDTLLSVNEYLESDYPESSGLKYVFTYGILQALFIQQDAVRNLSEAFNIKYKYNDRLKEIRSIRNSAIGHPTKQNIGSKTYYNYISRISLQKDGFTLQQSNVEQEEDKFRHIKLIEIINSQIIEILDILKRISNDLQKIDTEHKKKYKGVLMMSLLPPSLNYSFEKIGEAIYSSGFGKIEWGLSMLETVEESYQELENELLQRKELPGNKYLQFDLNQYKYGLSKIHDYLTENIDKMTEADARIYLYYIREKHKYFLNIAREFDEEYNQ